MGVCYNENNKRKKNIINYNKKEEVKKEINKNENDNKKENKEENQNNNENKEEENENKENIINNPPNPLNNIEEDSKESENNNLDDIPYRNILMLRELNPYLQTKNNPNFNFPEIEGNIYVGKGLRRMKGYISIVPKEELEKKRVAFWGTRVEGDAQVWNFLKELCELPIGEEKNIKAMLEANEITPLLKCINVTYDRNGAVYEIPNYCINDPVKYDFPEMHVKKPKKKNISYFARKGLKQVKIESSNMDLVEKVKEIIGKELEIQDKDVRLFFSGKELKNGNELWKYKIDNECVIIAL